MNATELRIGNIVFYNSENDNNEPVRYYCTINGADLRIMQDDENYLKSHEPVPLTDELLEKCGFKIFPWGYVIKSSNDFGIRLNLKSFVYEVSGNSAVKIEYLHQLQNLYFALTGEELEINLEEK